MNRKLDITSRHRAIKVLKALIEYPYHYTIKDLANQNEVSVDAVRDDITAIANAGFETTFDKHYRYAIIYSKPFEYIKEILFLSEAEYDLIQKALKQSNETNPSLLKTLKKLESIYDYTKYGNQTISKVYLKKIDLLEKAKTDKQKVQLINYKSTNSQITSDRTLEVFQIIPKDDLIHAFDPKHDETRLFRISRFEKIIQLDEDWENEGKHHILYPDIFSIVDKSTKKVHIKMGVGALNALLDRYPLAKAHVSPSVDEPNVHELECNVNSKYIGLINFLLGNHDNIIEILEPQDLIDTLNYKIKNMKF